MIVMEDEIAELMSVCFLKMNRLSPLNNRELASRIRAILK